MPNQGPKQPFNLNWIGAKKQSSPKRGRVISTSDTFTDSRGTEYFRLPSGQIRRMTEKC